MQDLVYKLYFEESNECLGMYITHTYQNHLILIKFC